MYYLSFNVLGLGSWVLDLNIGIFVKMSIICHNPLVNMY